MHVTAARVVFCFAMLAALALSEDIFTRLRKVLASSGQGDLAATELAKNNFARVQEILANTKSSDEPARAEILSLEGAVAFLQGDFNGSAIAFDRAAALTPLADADRFTLAMALVKQGAEKRAGGILEELSHKHPDHSLYLYWLGRLDYNQRRYQEAAGKLTRAVELDSNSARAWNSLGLTFDMQGRLEQAQNALERAADLNRKQAHPSPWPPHDLGFLLLRMDRPKEAEASLRESLRYDPAFPQSHYHLGRTLEKEGLDEAAVEEYKKAVAIDPASSDACYSLALLYRKAHRDAEAAAMFTEYKKRRREQSVPDLTTDR